MQVQEGRQREEIRKDTVKDKEKKRGKGKVWKGRGKEGLRKDMER